MIQESKAQWIMQVRWKWQRPLSNQQCTHAYFESKQLLYLMEIVSLGYSNPFQGDQLRYRKRS